MQKVSIGLDCRKHFFPSLQQYLSINCLSRWCPLHIVYTKIGWPTIHVVNYFIKLDLQTYEFIEIYPESVNKRFIDTPN